MPSDQITAFSHEIHDRLTCDETLFQKVYLGAIVDRVGGDHHQIRIVSRKDVMEQAVQANRDQISGVRSYVRKWRSLRESNPSYQIENLVS
jgi:hypothetical protein